MCQPRGDKAHCKIGLMDVIDKKKMLRRPIPRVVDKQDDVASLVILKTTKTGVICNGYDNGVALKRLTIV